MSTTRNTTDAVEIRAILEARKAEGEARAKSRRLREEWIEREAAGQAR